VDVTFIKLLKCIIMSSRHVSILLYHHNSPLWKRCTIPWKA